MISAQELRIGNYVNVPNIAQCPFRIDGFEYLDSGNGKVLQKTGTYYVEHFGDIPFHPLTWDLKDLSPIPITTEILEKAGFNRDSEGWYLSAEFKIYDPLEIGGIGCKSQQVKRDAYAVMYKGKIIGYRAYRFFHDIQNLIFSLTGKELEINL